MNNNKKTLQKYTYIMTFFSIIFLIIFNYFFNKYFIEKKYMFISLICIFILPIIMLFFLLHNNIVIERKSDKDEITILKDEIKSEKSISSTIPVLLFGLGIIYGQFKDKPYLSIILPYLLLAVIFGSILPEIGKHLIINYESLIKLFTITHIIFLCNSIAFGLLIASLILPIYMKIYK